MTQPTVKLAFILNESPVSIEVVPTVTALEVLRSTMGLTGAKEACGVGECGACTFLVNDVPTLGCLLLAAEMEGCRVTTIESDHDERVTRMRAAFLAESALQCGFCTPGMILAASRIPAGVSEDEIRAALVGNLCRCTGYSSIVRAIRHAMRTEPSDG